METLFHMPREIPLRNAVQYFWQVKSDSKSFSKQIIIPKGIVEIIFNFIPEITFNTKLNHNHFTIPKYFIQGYHTCPFEMDMPDRQEMFGIALHPIAVRRILGVPAGEFARNCIDLVGTEPSLHPLWHQLAEKEKFEERINIFSKWLVSGLFGLTAREQALNNLLALKTSKHLSISEISDWLCYSPRHLSRKLHELTGMNAEQTLLYLKYLKTIELMHRSNLTLSQIAHASDFTDQSHFIRTFKLFTTMTPKEYRKKKSEITGHYFENVR